MRTQVVYLSHGNLVRLGLETYNDTTEAWEPVADMSGVTKITLTFGSTLIESTDKAAGPIKWDQPGYAAGEIVCDLGEQTIPAGDYTDDNACPLVVYDATYTTGWVWGKVPMYVHAEVEGT